MRGLALAAVLTWSLACLAEPEATSGVAPAAPRGGGWRFGATTRYGSLQPRNMLNLGLEAHGGAELGAGLALLASVGVSGGMQLFNTACDQCWQNGPNSLPTSGVVWGSALVEYAFANKWLFVALGPLLGNGAWAGTVAAGQGVVMNDLVFGGDLRLGATLGPMDPVTGRRAGVTVGAGLLAFFGTGRLYTPGAEGRDGVYTGRGTAWGLVPSLLVGFDLR